MKKWFKKLFPELIGGRGARMAGTVTGRTPSYPDYQQLPRSDLTATTVAELSRRIREEMMANVFLEDRDGVALRAIPHPVDLDEYARGERLNTGRWTYHPDTRTWTLAVEPREPFDSRGPGPW